MTRALAHIEKIKKILPIAGADSIDVATVLGWECVVKKGEFQEDELVVYVEIDSIMPQLPEFEFLRDRKYRIKTIKLRGQISQGLVLPLSILPIGKRYKEGMDVTDIIGIRKYDPQLESELAELAGEMQSSSFLKKYLMRFDWFRKIVSKRNKNTFPTWIKKTDEERVQNIPSVLTRNADVLFDITEKLDGQSATFFLTKTKGFFGSTYKFGVCSRNRIVKNKNTSYWKIAKKFNIESVLLNIIGDNKTVVLQGEIIGIGIQKNKYAIPDYDFYAFNLILSGEKVPTKVMEHLLKVFDIKTVPFITQVYLPSNVQEVVNFATDKSKVNPQVWREGIVIRNYERNISFKAISPTFLLQNKE